MTTAATILGILLALTPLFVKWVYRKWKAKDDPLTKVNADDSAFNIAVVTGDTNTVAADLSARLGRLQDLSPKNPSPTSGPRTGPIDD